MKIKEYRFLDGSIVTVPDNTCRGCYLEKNTIMLEELNPIWQNKDYIIRQDAECPVPGFYIISARKHINTIGDLSQKQSSDLGIILNRLRISMMNSIDVKRVHIILEERIYEPHLHIWMLPLWKCIMEKYSIDPKVWNSNIFDYINLFTYEENKDRILSFNRVMRESLNNDQIMKQL
ncbi:hypothetical protein [uncultured Ruminococcus sp.]|uniref:hypothetical protein n=1 Tax=uncultured Ruminococcus sp. TaxID=165186 RepID=UPI0025E5FB9F|nr:hypothetical protein [uncultured Ruminococcus sp.]